MRIEIIGNIASGKTTLANVLSNRYESIFENFRANPFWEKFYECPDRYNFETEITFTLQHYHQIKLALAGGADFVCDFSLLLDQSYADVTLSGTRYGTYIQVVKELEKEIGPPDTIVHLTCPEQRLMQRIQQRGRDTEKSITISYLRNLTSKINRELDKVSGAIRIIYIDSDCLDYANIQEDQKAVISVVESAFGIRD
jgi:deoxyadenosine/deoxycytidine kinase